MREGGREGGRERGELVKLFATEKTAHKCSPLFMSPNGFPEAR